MNKFINIGFGSVVSADKIVGIMNPESAPMKRMIRQAKEEGRFWDGTFGRRTRAVIITESNHVISSGIQVETLVNRLSEKHKNTGD